MFFSNQRLREYWEGKRRLVEEGPFCEESRIRRFSLLCSYQGNIANYPESRVLGQNFIFRRKFLSVDFF